CLRWRLLNRPEDNLYAHDLHPQLHGDSHPALAHQHLFRLLWLSALGLLSRSLQQPFLVVAARSHHRRAGLLGLSPSFLHGPRTIRRPYGEQSTPSTPCIATRDAAGYG